MAIEFFREPTADEKKDFKPIAYKERDAQAIFKEKLEKTEKEYLSKHKPFCSRCAKLDFKEEWEGKIKEFERKVGHFKVKDLKLTDFDLNEYGKLDRFKQEGEKDAMEPIGKADFSRGDVTRKVKIGVHRDYRCQVRGCGISLFIPNSELSVEVKKK